MTTIKLKLKVLSSNYGVCRFDPHTEVPSWAMQGDFFTVSKSQEELSIVCQASLIPADIKAEKEWRIFKIEGPFSFTQIGILNAVTSVLSENGISLFAVSTFDTDYIMVKCADLDRSIQALRKAEHQVDDSAR
jgi:hypothetical protein